MIRRKGTIVSVGNASGAVPPFPPLKLVEKNVRLLRPTCVSPSPSPLRRRRCSDAPRAGWATTSTRPRRAGCTAGSCSGSSPTARSG